MSVLSLNLCVLEQNKKERIEFTIMFSSSIFYREDEKADLVIEENTSHSSSSISSKSSNSSDRYGSSFAQPYIVKQRQQWAYNLFYCSYRLEVVTNLVL